MFWGFVAATLTGGSKLCVIESFMIGGEVAMARSCRQQASQMFSREMKFRGYLSRHVNADIRITPRGGLFPEILVLGLKTFFDLSLRTRDGQFPRWYWCFLTGCFGQPVSDFISL